MNQKMTDWSALLRSIFIVVTGGQVVIIQPVVIQALTEYSGFSPEQSGYILSTEMWGFAFTTIALVFLTSRISWRLLIYIALTLMIAGNIFSLVMSSPTSFSVCRFIAGMGAGALVSLGFATVGLLPNTDRNYGYTILGALSYGALVLFIAPSLLGVIGMNGLIFIFIGTASIALCLVNGLPLKSTHEPHKSNSTATSSLLNKTLALAAMLTYFIAQGAIWSYLFLIGTDSGISEENVASGLGLSQFAGIAGAATAAFVANNLGRPPLLIAGISLGIIPLYFLFDSNTYIVFTLIACIYNFGWNMTHPYLLAVMATLDTSGRMVVYAVAMQKIGLAVGPALAAMLVSDKGYSDVLVLGMLSFGISLCCILFPAIQTEKKHSAAER